MNAKPASMKPGVTSNPYPSMISSHQQCCCLDFPNLADAAISHQEIGGEGFFKTFFRLEDQTVLDKMLIGVSYSRFARRALMFRTSARYLINTLHEVFYRFEAQSTRVRVH